MVDFYVIFSQLFCFLQYYTTQSVAPKKQVILQFNIYPKNKVLYLMLCMYIWAYDNWLVLNMTNK
jgi:hypothetical protein